MAGALTVTVMVTEDGIDGVVVPGDMAMATVMAIQVGVTAIRVTAIRVGVIILLWGYPWSQRRRRHRKPRANKAIGRKEYTKLRRIFV